MNINRLTIYRILFSISVLSSVFAPMVYMFMDRGPHDAEGFVGLARFIVFCGTVLVTGLPLAVIFWVKGFRKKHFSKTLLLASIMAIFWPVWLSFLGGGGWIWLVAVMSFFGIHR